jgi:hypothetical protein
MNETFQSLRLQLKHHAVPATSTSMELEHFGVAEFVTNEDKLTLKNKL